MILTEDSNHAEIKVRNLESPCPSVELEQEYHE